MSTAEDLQAIQNLLADYCLTADECRFEDWADLFGEDGEMYAFRRSWTGKDVLVGFLSNAPEGVHLNGLPKVDLDGDRADVVSNFVFFTHDQVVGSMGIYRDEVVRTGDGWRFKRRAIEMAKPSEQAQAAASD